MNRKGGRQISNPGESAKIFPLNMRTTNHVRSLIEHAAAKNGRSLSMEAEMRIRRSFEVDEIPEMVRKIMREEIARVLGGIRSDL